MRLVIIAIHFPPMSTSAAVQLSDLANEFSHQGHDVTVLTPAPNQSVPWRIEFFRNVQVVRLKTSEYRDLGFLTRTIAEFMVPFFMLHNLRKTSLSMEQWDGVVWYSPTIFLGPLAKSLKKQSNCRAYLIVRDIFPEWAVDLGLMGKGLPYIFFKIVSIFQYSVADIIGVQTAGNLGYLSGLRRRNGKRVEVLHNWLKPSSNMSCSIDISETKLAGKSILVYAGNMGLAQGMGIMMKLVEALQCRNDIGFLFVGRGSDTLIMRQISVDKDLNNVIFFDEIPSDEIPGLYAQCDIGLVTLDFRHKSHNIPGKFISYMQNGLPVLASVNSNNDLVHLIESERVGKVVKGASVEILNQYAVSLVAEVNQDNDFSHRCKSLGDRLFNPTIAAKQIANGLL
jgi:glycosyltransferase involved in cell wall biosynthesis